MDEHPSAPIYGPTVTTSLGTSENKNRVAYNLRHQRDDIIALHVRVKSILRLKRTFMNLKKFTPVDHISTVRSFLFRTLFVRKLVKIPNNIAPPTVFCNVLRLNSTHFRGKTSCIVDSQFKNCMGKWTAKIGATYSIGVFYMIKPKVVEWFWNSTELMSDLFVNFELIVVEVEND